ncbi:hypothetical protein PoB_003876600 [Plakobranchus ocellatus]|uniref:THAP-type domain-containing protein n=1 Tax=Plakobranchus ocellatus TaxID=259542 RepID=A0AAV4AVT1_9GAST|nr:hypothetical protein PoB_003876600 [Plakobranchus ocellatus]
MGRKCCVYVCTSKYASNPEKVTVYRFPKDNEQRKQWLRSIPNKLSEGEITDYIAVCALHFRPDTLLSIGGRYHYQVPLEPPSVFPNVPSSCRSTPQPKPRTTQSLSGFRTDVTIAGELKECRLKDTRINTYFFQILDQASLSSSDQRVFRTYLYGTRNRHGVINCPESDCDVTWPSSTQESVLLRLLCIPLDYTGEDERRVLTTGQPRIFIHVAQACALESYCPLQVGQPPASKALTHFNGCLELRNNTEEQTVNLAPGKDRRIKSKPPALRLATWNIRTMCPGLSKDLLKVDDSRKTTIISCELERLNIDMAALQYTRLPSNSSLGEKDYTYFWQRKRPEEHGVGSIVSQ